jgi:DNA invertase Pin-like site-specific DNA recombinase
MAATDTRQIDLEDAIAAASPRVWGYACVTTDEQHTSAQESELRAAGSHDVMLEIGSGTGDLPGLRSLVARLRPGDALAVTEVWRLGRTTAGVLRLSDELRWRGAALHVTRLGIDTSTRAGRFALSIFAALASYEGCRLPERLRAEIAIPRAGSGRYRRPRILSDVQIDNAADQVRAGATLSATAARFGVCLQTLTKYIRQLHPDMVLPRPGGRLGIPRPRMRGRSSGRPRILSNVQIDDAADRVRAGATLSATAALFGVSLPTLISYVRKRHPEMVLPRRGRRRSVSLSPDAVAETKANSIGQRGTHG